MEGLDRLIWAVIVLGRCLCGHGSAPEQFPPRLADLRSAGSGLQHPARGWLVLFPLASDARLASGLFSTAQLIAFAAVAAPLSYIAASANLPLCDAALDTIDRALGFDWEALLTWMNTAPIALPRAAPDLSEPHPANDDGGAVPRLLWPASLATDLYPRISLRGPRLHRDICRAASRGRMAPLRPHGKPFRDIARGKHQLACILRIARRKFRAPGSGRFRGNHHLPEPACRAGRSRYCRALARAIPALGGCLSSIQRCSSLHPSTARIISAMSSPEVALAALSLLIAQTVAARGAALIARVRLSYHLMPASGDNPIEPLDPPLMQR